MAIFSLDNMTNSDIISEGVLSNIFKKKSENKKDEEKYEGKYTVIRVSSPSESVFNKLYHNEALTAEGCHVNDDDNLDIFNNWFRKNSKCSASNVNFYVIKGNIMNSFYHLTGDNKYPNDFTIVCIDWLEAKAKEPYKGQWRWFSDVVDNNARREIAKKNPHYKHYHSIYYGNIGWEDE